MRNLIFLTLIFISAFLTSCNQHLHKTTSSGAYESSGYGGGQGGGHGSTVQYDNNISQPLEKRKLINQESLQDRKVIYNGIVALQVKSPDSTNNQLTEIAKRYEGYVQTLGTNKSVIRVKSELLSTAVKDICTLGKVESQRISGQDVTDEYTNLGIRLENANNARKRYLELLAKAENVEAALKVEKELERINLEIDTYTGRINQIGHLSSYSTITVNIREKVKPGIIGYVGIGLYKSVRWLFVRN